MAFDTTSGKYYLLSSQARVQVPYIKVTIGKYVFGVFSKESKNENNLKQFEIEYPNYIQSLRDKHGFRLFRRTLEARRYWSKVFKIMKESYLQPTIVDSAKLSMR